MGQMEYYLCFIYLSYQTWHKDMYFLFFFFFYIFYRLNKIYVSNLKYEEGIIRQWRTNTKSLNWKNRTVLPPFAIRRFPLTSPLAPEPAADIATTLGLQPWYLLRCPLAIDDPLIRLVLESPRVLTEMSLFSCKWFSSCNYGFMDRLVALVEVSFNLLLWEFFSASLT